VYTHAHTHTHVKLSLRVSLISFEENQAFRVSFANAGFHSQTPTDDDPTMVPHYDVTMQNLDEESASQKRGYLSDSEPRKKQRSDEPDHADEVIKVATRCMGALGRACACACAEHEDL
jgi:hypothetical protein